MAVTVAGAAVHGRSPSLLIVLGALTVTDALITLVWQEPLSALYADLRQSNLSGELRSVERAVPGPATARALANISDERQRIALLARELEHHASNGSPIGRIVIPKIGANFVVVDGTDTEDLMSGPGIMTETTFPGSPGPPRSPDTEPRTSRRSATSTRSIPGTRSSC